jgi:hypothetical protein
MSTYCSVIYWDKIKKKFQYVHTRAFMVLLEIEISACQLDQVSCVARLPEQLNDLRELLP